MGLPLTEMGQRGKQCAVRAEQTDRVAMVSIPLQSQKEAAGPGDLKRKRSVQLPLESNTKAREGKVASEV